MLSSDTIELALGSTAWAAEQLVTSRQGTTAIKASSGLVNKTYLLLKHVK